MQLSILPNYGTVVIQLTPALTDIKGPTIFICYRRISVIANIEIKEKLFMGLKTIFCYRRISVAGGSVRAGFNCIHFQMIFFCFCILQNELIFVPIGPIWLNLENMLPDSRYARVKN